MAEGLRCVYAGMQIKGGKLNETRVIYRSLRAAYRNDYHDE